MKQRATIQTNNSADLAFALIVLASYFPIFNVLPTASPFEIVLLIFTGTAYIMMGIYGYGFCVQSPSMLVKVAYILVQLPLGGMLIYLGRGAGFNAMILLPLAGHSVVLFKQSLMLFANLAIIATYLITRLQFISSLDDIWASMPIFLAGQMFIVAFTQMAANAENARTQVERLVDEIAAANERLREYAQQVEELTITKERNRMAREIHDGVGHFLTTVNIQIKAAIAVMENDPKKALKSLKIAQNQAQQALVDVRQSVAALRSTVEEYLPLPQRIEHIISNSQVDGLLVNFECTGTPRPLSPQVELTVYRAVQEGINNTQKHAKASEMTIKLWYTDNQTVVLEMADNGIGINKIKEGFGLLGLKERANLLHGYLTIQSGKKQGFNIRLEIPA
ncbi:MAG: sensor histidine kinase [Anaerolineaceae bacterium]|nr:sensor histidine kinase [Anaerolineaceae bacterium]